MNTLEITAASKKEAAAKAADKLGVDVAELEVEVIEETAGLFGKGKVRIRATAQDNAPVAEPEPKPKPKHTPEPEPKPDPEVAKEPEAPKEKKDEAPAKGSRREQREDVVASEDDAEQLIAILVEILELADLEAEISVSEINGRYVNIELDGDDVSYLVGRRGEVLNALQYLMNVMS